MTSTKVSLTALFALIFAFVPTSPADAEPVCGLPQQITDIPQSVPENETLVYVYENKAAETVTATTVQQVQEHVEIAMESCDIVAIEENVEIELPFYHDPEGFSLSSVEPDYVTGWEFERLGVPNARALGFTGEGVTIAVIDTGVQSDHPDLSVVGLFDTFRLREVETMDDPDGHGTRVAGTATYVAPDVDILGVKIFESKHTYVANVSNAIHWSVDNGADIINMSFSGVMRNYTMESALEYAERKGVKLVGSNGNSYSLGSPLQFPAAHESVIAVTATDVYGARAHFSSVNDSATVAAPGVNVAGAHEDGGRVLWSGTSAAAPMVSGTIALMESAHTFGGSNDYHRDVLIDTAWSRNGRWTPDFGHGEIRTDDAVRRVLADMQISPNGHPQNDGVDASVERLLLPTSNRYVAAASHVARERARGGVGSVNDLWFDVSNETWVSYQTSSLSGLEDTKTQLEQFIGQRHHSIGVVFRNGSWHIHAVTFDMDGPAPGPFQDVAADSIFHDDIMQALVFNVASGQQDRSFQPWHPVTRGQSLAMLHRASGSPPANLTYLNKFSDVNSSSTFAEPVAWAVENGITQGYADGTFRSHDNVSRQGFIAFMYNTSDNRGDAFTENAGTFPDVPHNHLFENEIGWATFFSITGGYPDGTFRPNSPLLRQHAVAFLSRDNRFATDGGRFGRT